MNNIKTNWNDYNEKYPTRYLKQNTLFDQAILNLLIEKQPKTILDYAGGINGTQAISTFQNLNHIFQCDLFDPYVNNKQNWHNNHIKKIQSLQSKYDFIILRGSINYLTIEEIKNLQKYLNHTGTIVFNTFLEKPIPQEKKVLNSLNEIGIEKTHLENNIIKHKLVFERYTENHDFYYYSEEIFTSLYKNIKFTKYNNNSYIGLIEI